MSAKKILKQLHEAYERDPAAEGERAAKEDNARDKYAKAYIKAHVAAVNAAEDVMKAIEAHRTKAAIKNRDKAINYGYVGDLGHVAEQLKDILDFLK